MTRLRKTSRTTTIPASTIAMASILLRPLAGPPVGGNNRGGVAVGGMDVAVGGMDVAGGKAVGGVDVAVGGVDVVVGGVDVTVGGMDVAVGEGVGVKPADTGATCQTMAPMTNRIKTPITLVEISLDTMDNLLCFHGVLQLARFLPGLLMVTTQPAPFDLSADRAGYAPRSLSGVKRSRRSAARSLSKAEGRSGC